MWAERGRHASEEEAEDERRRMGVWCFYFMFFQLSTECRQRVRESGRRRGGREREA